MDNRFLIDVNGLTVQVLLKKIKNIRLTVYPSGEIKISAPVGCKKDRIINFIKDKTTWIDKQLKKFSANKTVQEKKQRKYLEGEEFFVFGEKFILKIYKSDTDEAFCKDGFLVVKSSKGGSLAERKRAVLSFYGKILEDYVAKRIVYYVGLTGLKPTTIEYKNLKSVWGKCYSQSGKVVFALQLATIDKQLIDYVILHELCHLKIPNHSKDFHLLTERFMPGALVRRKCLRLKNEKYLTRV